MPPTLMTHSKLLTLKFVSDYSDSSDGFEVSFDFIDFKQQCGGRILSTTGSIVSIGWPANYLNNLDCNWTLATPSGTQVELQFELFELEESENCVADFLEVR